MNRCRSAMALLLLSAATGLSQQQPGLPLPRLDVITPPGGKAGGEVAEFSFTGVDIEEAQSLIFGHPGIKAALIPPPPPKVDPKDPKKQPTPPKGPLPGAKFKLTIAADVPPGNYDVRVVNKWGVSNPRTFVVGNLAEVAEKEPNNDVPDAQKIEVNTTVNGVVSAPTDVDLYQFAGKKGKRVVLACLSGSIDGRANPIVECYNAAGRILASNTGYAYRDAVTDVIIPEDGDYFVRVAEFTYTTGGPSHSYRLTVTTNPWIDAVFPPMVEPGKATAVTLYGRNLPGGVIEPGLYAGGRPVEKAQVTVTAPAEGAKLAFRGRVDPRMAGGDGFEYRLKGPDGFSNGILISLSSDKTIVEVEPNDKGDQAKEIAVPCEIAGRIGKSGDRDWFAFNAKKGDTFVIDLWAERLGTPADFVFGVRSSKATTDMTEKDDNAEVLGTTQFFTRTSDPEPYRFTAAEDGKYFVHVGTRDYSAKDSVRLAYRLRISAEKPDFRLISMPGSTYLPDVTVLRADGHNYLDVFAFRSDGFTGPIALSVEGLPAGVSAAPCLIGVGQKSGALVLTAAPTAASFNGPIVIKGTAVVNGKQVVREARPATITFGGQPQQNTPMITRLDNSPMMLAVRDKAFFRINAEPENAFVKMGEKLPQPLRIKQGEKLTVPFKINRISPDAKVPITLQQKTTGQNAQQSPLTVNNGQAMAAIAADKNEGTIVIDAKNSATPGMYTVVMRATCQVQYDKDPMGKKKATTVEQAVNPIVVQVLPTSLGRITATPAGTLKGGMKSEVLVKVDRQHDFAGEFKLKVQLPMNAKGVTVADVVIPAGQNEAKIVFTAAADAPAGPLQNITVVATAMFDGAVPITQEAKFNVTVEKAPAPPKK